MGLVDALRAPLLRFTTRRHRRILAASVVTLVVSGFLLGLTSFIQWRGHRALQSDTGTIVEKSSQQLARALTSRRGTLTFMRDILNRSPDLSASQLRAMGISGVDHTRHMLGAGLIRAKSSPVWWSGPRQITKGERTKLNRAIANRTKLRGIWNVPSTFVAMPGKKRPILIMLEPLKRGAFRRSAIIGIFDVKPLLEDFFAAALPQRHPVQLFDDKTLLYRSDDWQISDNSQQPPIVAEDSFAIDAARWNIQMQPGTSGLSQTLSWFNLLLIALSIIAGLGITIIVWILAARTWILQRAVNRRTSALKRASERLRQLAITDELTGLYNRRFFLDRLSRECDRARRYGRPLACLMVDVNGFKQVNDQIGHHAGDLVLKHVARELKDALRQTDILARFGGDEFIIALPETSNAQAAQVAEKLRQVKISVPNRQRRYAAPVSLSVGLSPVKYDHKSPSDIIQAADRSLYDNKRKINANSRTKSTGDAHAPFAY